MNTFVIVPVLNRWELTAKFLQSLEPDEVDDLLVIDNGSTDWTASNIRQLQHLSRKRGERVKLRRVTNRGSIYEMWNDGCRRALRRAAGGECYLLVSNNDVTLPLGAIPALRRCLQASPGVWVAYPDVDAPWLPDARRSALSERATRGVFGDGGMFGACFMLAAHRIPWTPLVTDPGYRWWYGDNHLAEMIEQAGGEQRRVEGLPVKHVNEGTARHHPHLEALKWQDRQRWLHRYDAW